MKEFSAVIFQIVRIPQGGIRKHIVEIVEALLKYPNIKIILITDTSEQDEVFSKWWEENKNKSQLELYQQRISVNPHARDLKNIFHLLFLIKKYRPQILHGHGAKGGVYARLGCLLSKLFFFSFSVRSIYTAHGGFLHNVFHPMMKTIYQIVENCLAPLTDLVIFESQYSKNRFESLIKIRPKRTVLIHNGIALNNFNSLMQVRKAFPIKKIACFGALRKIKGHDLLIEALSDSDLKEYDWHLTLVGTGEEKQNLERQIFFYNMSSRISFIEHTSDPMKLMTNFDGIIQPSRHESFGYVLIEAMSLGIPVLSSDAGGMKEIMKDGHNGLVFASENKQSLKNKLKELFTLSEEIRKDYINNAFKTLEENFDLKEMQVKTIKEYYNLISSFILFFILSNVSSC